MDEMDNIQETAPDVQIDYLAIINQIADKVITDFLTSISPDEKTQKLLTGLIAIHRKYGIDAATSMKIMVDMGKLWEESDSDGANKNGATD